MKWNKNPKTIDSVVIPLHCTVSNHSIAAPCRCHWKRQWFNYNISPQFLIRSTLQFLFNSLLFSWGTKTEASDRTAWQQCKQRDAKSRADKCWRHFRLKCESLMSQLFSLTLTEPSCLFFFLFWIIRWADMRLVSLNWGCALNNI